MKKIIILFALLLMIFSCRKKCTEGVSTKKSLDATLDGYFGVYEKGNYWLYENQDKTKKDSIYVTAYDRKFGLESPPCQDIESLEYTLKAIGHDIVISDSVCLRCNLNVLNINVCASAGLFDGYLLSFHFYPDTIYAAAGKVSQLNIVKLNNQIFYDQIMQFDRNGDTLYIQKGIGIIGWKKNNDTYNLVSKYLQP